MDADGGASPSSPAAWSGCTGVKPRQPPPYAPRGPQLPGHLPVPPQLLPVCSCGGTGPDGLLGSMEGFLRLPPRSRTWGCTERSPHSPYDPRHWAETWPPGGAAGPMARLEVESIRPGVDVGAASPAPLTQRGLMSRPKGLTPGPRLQGQQGLSPSPPATLRGPHP